MTSKEKLSTLRQEIDGIDAQLVQLFQDRMLISEKVAEVKAEGNIAIVDEHREQHILDQATKTAGKENKAAVISFMRTLIALSKIKQTHQLMLADPIAFPPSTALKKENLTVAYQGVQGAWSEHSAVSLYPNAALKQCDYFEDVVTMVKSGKADYGVLPIENSHTGAIGEVYDLLRHHACYIVGQVWIQVAQCLLAKEETVLSDIREIYSHPEGFNQCRRYLKNKNWDLTACRNTAFAAKMVADQSSNKFAAIGSRRAAQVHNLSILVPDIMDNTNNKTRFIAIASQPVYDESCEMTSITFSTVHRSGALCAVLESFMLAGINLSRIESRPVSTEKYRFFADLQANIMDPKMLDALQLAAMHCDYFEILGCYQTTPEA